MIKAFPKKVITAIVKDFKQFDGRSDLKTGKHFIDPYTFVHYCLISNSIEQPLLQIIKRPESDFYEYRTMTQEITTKFMEKQNESKS